MTVLKNKWLAAPVLALPALAVASGMAAAEPTQPLSHNIGEVVATPHLTWQTRFLNKTTTFDNLVLNPVCEGIFGFQEPNRSIGWGSYWGFYTIDGRCLFAPQWEQAGERPRFDSGVAVVRKPKGNNVILYSDGSVKELPESWKDVTQFYDGVACVTTGGWGVRTIEYFFINTSGKRIWPHLDGCQGARPLRDGRRAFKKRDGALWGFMDADGKVVITPRYADVRDFANGYALVIEKPDVVKFIDTSGRDVVTLGQTASTLQYAANVSDISNGYYLVETSGSGSTFHNLKGEAVRNFVDASPFNGGYAFVRDNRDKPIFTVDTAFNRVYTLAGVNLMTGRVLLSPQTPEFGAMGLGTIDRELVVTPKGRPVISCQGFNGYAIGDFIPSAYAAACTQLTDPVTKEKREYKGYVNTAGEFMVVFDKNPEAAGPFPGDLPEPAYPQPIINDPRPDPPVLPGVDTIPAGPKVYHQAVYDVKVAASPVQGGAVTGSGKYHYGDTVTVSATPAKGWILTDIAATHPFSVTGKPNRFRVVGDMEITAYFFEEEDATPMRTGAYIGASRQLLPGTAFTTSSGNLEVYLQTDATSSLETPYGPETGGFFTILLNPDEKLQAGVVSGSGEGFGTFNAFFAPMRVGGQTVDADGCRWLLLDGGVFKINNVRVVNAGASNGAANQMSAAMANLMLAFDGMDMDLDSGHYRVEMTDIDPATGAFTFGEIQRFHPHAGWIPGGDRRFMKESRGAFVRKYESGLPAGWLKGVRMQPTQPRSDILWTPTAGFYEGDASALEGVARNLGEQCRNFKSELDHVRKK